MRKGTAEPYRGETAVPTLLCDTNVHEFVPPPSTGTDHGGAKSPSPVPPHEVGLGPPGGLAPQMGPPKMGPSPTPRPTTTQKIGHATRYPLGTLCYACQGNWPPHTGAGVPGTAQPSSGPALAAPQGCPWPWRRPLGAARPCAAPVPSAAPCPGPWPAPHPSSGQAAGPRVRLAEHGLGSPPAIFRRGAQHRGAQCHQEPGGGRRAEPSELMSIFCIKYFDN